MSNQVLQHSMQALRGAAGLRADLHDVPLASLLELVNTSKQTGLAEVETFLGRTSVTLRLGFIGGELVDCAILDWRGLDALFSFPQDTATGHFQFAALSPAEVSEQAPLAPFRYVMSEWARLSDEWPRYNGWIGSPSVRLSGPLPPFNQPGGSSVRAAAHAARQPLHEVAARAAELVRAGSLTLLPGPVQQEWQFLRLPAADLPSVREAHRLLGQADSAVPLGSLAMQAGVPLGTLRTELLRALQRGYRFPGCGWVLRDLIWEQDWEEVDRQASD